MRQSEQQLLKAEVDRHLAEGTTTMAAGEWLNPISEYTADERLQLEGERLFRRLPLVAAHVSDLPDPGSFVSRTLFGVSLLIVHGSDRVIRALVNVCRHRGATVESQPSGCARRFTCPYHAWTFSNDGTLVGIPNAEGFEGIDRQSFGLVELPSATRHGFVWVGLDPEASLDLDDFLGELDPELGSWGLEHSHAVRSTRLEVEANWKLVIDGFLETYHVAFLHSESVAPYIRSNLGVFKEFGRHGRMANVRYRYAGEGQPLDDSFLYGVGGVYVLFPNTVILWHGTHLERYTITPAPGDPGRSVCDIELLAPTETRADMDKWNRNWDLVLGTITGEDFPMAVSAQAGFAGGYPSHFVFGRNEPFVQHFHRQLLAELDAIEGR